jgi:glucosylglycerate phosphorylase
LSGAEVRRELLEQLYGSSAGAAAAGEVEAVLAATGGLPPWRQDQWDEHDFWVIAYPDQFTEPPAAPLATLARFHARHLAPWVNGLHVLPFTPWSSDDGFAVIDYEAVDGRYGTWADIAVLGAQVRLMGDLVLNHLSSQSGWFTRFLAGDPAYASFFRTADPAADLAATVRPRTTPLLTRFDSSEGPRWVWTTFSSDQVDLDYRNPAVLVRVLEALLTSVRHGVQIIRLDAVAYLWKREGTPSIHLSETHAVIRFLRLCLDEVAPHVQLVTETNVPHAENVSYFGTAAAPEAQAVYQFALPPLVLDAFRTGDATTLAGWAEELRLDGPGTTFLNFLASHDGVGLRPAEGLLDAGAIEALGALARRAGGGVGWRTGTEGEPTVYELNSTWFELMAAGHSEPAGIRRHLAAHAVMLALRGIPLVYVHSLFASPNAVDLAQRTGRPRSVNRARFDLTALEAALASPTSRAARVLAGLAGMARLRAGCPAFHPDSPQRVLSTPPEIFGVERGRAGPDTARVYVNVSGAPATVDGLRLEPWSSAWLLPDRADATVFPDAGSGAESGGSASGARRS